MTDTLSQARICLSDVTNAVTLDARGIRMTRTSLACVRGLSVLKAGISQGFAIIADAMQEIRVLVSLVARLLSIQLTFLVARIVTALQFGVRKKCELR
jgi:hypothetical protein